MSSNYFKTCRASLAAMTLSLAAFLVGLWASAADVTENHGQLSENDYKFAKAAASGGILEVNLGKIAVGKSTNTDVQQFAQRMVTDHGKAGQNLAEIATHKGATLPSEPTSVQQKEFDVVSKLSGSEFDKAYIAFMVRAHKADEKEFKKASDTADDADLKAFDSTTLTMVEDHLRMAMDLDEGLKHKMSMNP